MHTSPNNTFSPIDICLYNLFFKKGYLADVPVLTMSRMNLRNPETSLCPKEGCTLMPAEKLDYCAKNVAPGGFYGKKGNAAFQATCAYRTGEEVMYPPPENGALMATTYMEVVHQTAPADCNPPQHPQW